MTRDEARHLLEGGYFTTPSGLYSFVVGFARVSFDKDTVVLMPRFIVTPRGVRTEDSFDFFVITPRAAASLGANYGILPMGERQIAATEWLEANLSVGEEILATAIGVETHGRPSDSPLSAHPCTFVGGLEHLRRLTGTAA